ncbi:potassium channel family protein [Tunicatimonas pelagia]|uniref:potassium channel family protein n=1 Tax=Tunicatimonas pelagia TaxID=931531 RepID=UPI0026663B3E|nr:potassium channel family protein [Tunicatimonas pelagia]WKN42179.1 potassium channel family protein [Tunicatimonas pelagia]
MLTTIILITIGVALVGFAIYDFAVTAYIPSGEGPVSGRINQAVFSIFFWLAGRDGRDARLQYVGLAIIFTLSFTWIAMIWTGFVCIFHAFPESVLQGQNKTPTDLFEKIYHVGYTLSTLGIGDYVPGNNFWRVATALVSFLGLVTITMSITYLVPVVSNAIQKRSLSLYIAGLGESPEQIVINSFNGENFKGIDNQLPDLASMIFTYAQNHLAYPILHHMHNANPSENIVLKLAALDEALTIFQFHVPEHLRPDKLGLQLIRRALTTYLKTVKHVNESDYPPPYAKFHIIEEYTGIQLLNTEGSARDALYESLEPRRMLTLGHLYADGWEWEDMRGEKFISSLEVRSEMIEVQS